jgi:hypothetical protein
MSNIQIARLLLIVVVMLPFSSTHASDGLLEINQACAVNTGCFTGDSPGFPVTITQPGSYRLTGNLDLSAENANTHGIHATAPATTVDLGGFRITGPASCSGNCSAITCSGGGLGVGVLLDVGAIGSVVRNGTVHNMGSTGIGVGALDSRVEKVTAFHNVQDGIGGDQHIMVLNVIAFENGQDGIDVDAGSSVDGSKTTCNANDGIQIDGPGGIATRSIARENGGNGFDLAGYGKYRDNVSTANGSPDTCGGGICTEHRRFYVTSSFHKGDTVLTACATGFHMASFWEISGVSDLRYDTSLGWTRIDSGFGAPVATGWIRTGGDSASIAAPGRGNCANWVSSSNSVYGTVLTPEFRWDNPALQVHPWYSSASICNETWRVWCVEDD